MAKRSDKKNIRNLTKTGGMSMGGTIPIDIIRKLGWKERQKVVVNLRGKKITIEDWPIRQAQGKKK